jgi:hypothetical protein
MSCLLPLEESSKWRTAAEIGAAAAPSFEIRAPPSMKGAL